MTLETASSGELTEKRSKFLSYAYPISSSEEALSLVQELRAKYYDARHVCWAYRLGMQGEDYRSNDDGEPSGTAGKPILGQLISQELSDVLVVVIRYFGGVKLGTSGLIEAYRGAAYLALTDAPRKEVIEMRSYELHFSYELMGTIMRQLKELGAAITAQDFQERCVLHFQLRAGDSAALEARLGTLYGAVLKAL